MGSKYFLWQEFDTSGLKKQRTQATENPCVEVNRHDNTWKAETDEVFVECKNGYGSCGKIPDPHFNLYLFSSVKKYIILQIETNFA